MKLFYTILSCLFAFFNQAQTLYPIEEGGKFGYIDKKGTLVISPTFNMAGNFADGLAPIRIDNRYGYINSSGDYAFPLQYSHANEFINGRALVSINYKPYFINTKGDLLFEHNYVELSSYNADGFCIAKDSASALHIIDQKGNTIVPQKFKAVEECSNGYFLVKSLPIQRNKFKKSTKAIVDTKGNWIVPFGRYSSLNVLKNGFIIAKEDHYNRYLLNPQGQVKFKFKKGWWEASRPIMIQELLYLNHPYLGNSNYMIAVDSNGIVAIDEPLFDIIAPFQGAVSLAFNKKTRTYYCINKKGAVLYTEKTLKPLDVFRGDMVYFHKGIGLFQVNKKLVILDHLGQKINKKMPLKYDRYYRYKNTAFICSHQTTSPNKDYWNPVTDEYFESLEAFEKTYPKQLPEDKLRLVTKIGSEGYINNKGTYIWVKKQTTLPLNIDYMTFTSFTISRYYNNQRLIKKSDNFPKNAVSVVLRPDEIDNKEKRFTAIKAYIVNSSSKPYRVVASHGGYIHLILEIKTPEGAWKPITVDYREEIKIFPLPNGYCWEYSIPQYAGTLKTKLRAKLVQDLIYQMPDPNIIYSNEIEVSINSGQLWKKQQ